MTDNYWHGRKVLVTGASGFIGSHVTELLVARGAEVTAATFTSVEGEADNLRHLHGDITALAADLTLFDDCLAICRDQDVVMNIAHADGSTAFKSARPAYIFRQNMLMTLHMLEAAATCGVERFLVMSSAEVYPPDAVAPTEEPEGFAGLPSRTTDGYAWSKRMSEFAAGAFAREHGLKVAIARPSNVYGPRDHFDVRKGRVIPMFIRQAFEGDGTINIWGTGEQVRTFLYVDDLATALLDLVDTYPTGEPVNIGGATEITIKELAEAIVRLSERDVRIVCDPAGPSGPQRRTTAIGKAESVIGFKPTVPLETGLARTIEAYQSRRGGLVTST